MSTEDLLAVIAAGPSGGGQAQQDTSVAKPIGIPKSYQPPGRSGIPFTSQDNGLLPSTAPTRQPYYDGSEFGPRILAPGKIAELQRTLAQLGLIGPKTKYRVGRWDEASSRAYKDVLAYANQGGIDADTALNELMQSGALERGDGQSTLEAEPIKAGNVVQLTDGATLEAQIQQAARNQLGRKLRTNEAKRFAAIYNGIERKDGAQANAAQDAAQLGADSTITRAPSPDAAAGQFIDSQFAQEQAGFSTLGYLDALKGLVG